MTTDNTKREYAWKVLSGRRHTVLDKEWYEELAATTYTHYDHLWSDALPVPAPGATTGIVYVYNTLTMTEDFTVSDHRAWLAIDGTQKVGFIPPVFDQSYSVRVYDNALTEIPTTDTSSWAFSYQAGVLWFENDPTTYGYTLPIKIKVYLYIGATGRSPAFPALTCEAAVAVRDAVYMHSTGELRRASASAIATTPAIGIVTSKPTATSCIAEHALVLDGYAALVAGGAVYLGTGAGTVTTTVPVGASNVVQRLGVAMSATKVLFLVDATTVELP